MYDNDDDLEDTCESLWNIELVVLQLIGLKSLRSAFSNREYRNLSLRESIVRGYGVFVFALYVFSSVWTMYLIDFSDISFAAEVMTVILSATMIMIKVLADDFKLEAYDEKNIKKPIDTDQVINLIKRHRHILNCDSPSMTKPIMALSLIFTI
ncbi:hypothetical protein G9C98_008328 [Cotesia typhae]|uniref:Uncharacterized protein n=1 Tax=Cotesia typhae TaxID=2053667 RepID=A0A8J5QUZ7_9HYME|nr:hypothetical protein G9C98_008328 [Cotesia typhae]